MVASFTRVMQSAAHWIEVSERGGYDPRVLLELRNAMAEYIAYVARHENHQTEGAMALLTNDYVLGRLQRCIGAEQGRRERQDQQHQRG
ncbi:MAG: hypothetical protein AB7I09_19835 [Planctomycetota bacterium]